MEIKGANRMIGTKIILGVYASREEKLGPKTGNRVVAARLYYSAKDDNELPVNVKNAAGEMYQNPEFMNNGKHSLIVYNHGYGSYMEANNKLCCELAANGYIVVSVGHAYEASSLLLEDGAVTRIILKKPNKIKGFRN